MITLIEIEKVIETLSEIKNTHEDLKAIEYDALIKSSKLLLEYKQIIRDSELPIADEMRKEYRRISEINDFKLPLDVLNDVNKRITDWIASGGEETDLYIQRQIAYAEQVHSLMIKAPTSEKE